MEPSWRSARIVQEQDFVSTTLLQQVVQERIVSIFTFAGNILLESAISVADANGTTIFNLTKIVNSFPNSSWMT